jgi:hypothetical protein
VNLGTIVKYAVALFAVQFLLGFLEGAFFSVEISSLVGGSLISFFACAGVFAHLFSRQVIRPFAHAWLALFLAVVVSTLLSYALARWLGSTPFILVLLILEWAVVACSLVAGSVVGSNMRRKRRVLADA